LEREEVRARYFLSPQTLEEGRVLLVGSDITDKFRLERMDVISRKQFATADYGIILIIGGSGMINGFGVQAGDRFFVPACENGLDCIGEMQFLYCTAAANNEMM
jgi:mannose-6-phosphate isomerase class I